MIPCECSKNNHVEFKYNKSRIPIGSTYNSEKLPKDCKVYIDCDNATKIIQLLYTYSKSDEIKLLIQFIDNIIKIKTSIKDIINNKTININDINKQMENYVRLFDVNKLKNLKSAGSILKEIYKINEFLYLYIDFYYLHKKNDDTYKFLFSTDFLDFIKKLKSIYETKKLNTGIQTLEAHHNELFQKTNINDYNSMFGIVTFLFEEMQKVCLHTILNQIKDRIKYFNKYKKILESIIYVNDSINVNIKNSDYDIKTINFIDKTFNINDSKYKFINLCIKEKNTSDQNKDCIDKIDNTILSNYEIVLPNIPYFTKTNTDYYEFKIGDDSILTGIRRDGTLDEDCKYHLACDLVKEIINLLKIESEKNEYKFIKAFQGIVSETNNDNYITKIIELYTQFKTMNLTFIDIEKIFLDHIYIFIIYEIQKYRKTNKNDSDPVKNIIVPRLKEYYKMEISDEPGLIELIKEHYLNKLSIYLKIYFKKNKRILLHTIKKQIRNANIPTIINIPSDTNLFKLDITQINYADKTFTVKGKKYKFINLCIYKNTSACIMSIHSEKVQLVTTDVEQIIPKASPPLQEKLQPQTTRRLTEESLKPPKPLRNRSRTQ